MNVSYYHFNIKSKVVPVLVMKAHKGNRSIAPLIINLGTRWRRVVIVTPLPLYAGIQ